MVAPDPEPVPVMEGPLSMTYAQLETFVIEQLGEATIANIKAVLSSTRISLK
jgi:hypothetical protein